MSRTDRLIRWGLFVILIFSPWYKGGKEILPFSIIQMITYFLFVLWIKKFYFFKNFDIKQTDLDIPLILFLVCAITSTIFSLYFHNSVLYLMGIITYCLIYYLLINTVSLKFSLNFFDFIYNSIVIIGCLLSFIGIYQYSKGLVVKATFPNPNFLAGYLVIGITIGLSNLLVGEIQPSNSTLSAASFNKRRILKFKILSLSSFIYYLVSTCVMFVCLIFTHSRGGIFSLFFALLFIFGIRFKVWGIISVLIVWLVLFVIFSPSSLMRIFKMGNIDPYVYQRPNIWKTSVAIMGENPSLGVGLGNFELGFYKHNFPVKNILARYSRYTRFAHSEILQIGTEMGIAALIIFLWMINLFLRKGMSIVNKRRQIENINCGYWRKYIITAFCGTVAILAHSLVDFNLHLPAIMLPLIFFVGTIMNFGNVSSYKLSCKKSLIWIIWSGIFCLLFFTSIISFGDFYAQRGDFKKAISFNPLNARYYKNLGDSFLKKWNKEIQDENLRRKILWAYKKMVSLSPYDSYYRDKLGRFFYKCDSKKFLIDALSEYKKAITYNPTEPFFRSHLAALYFNEGNYEKALSCWQEAIIIEPNFIEAHYKLGVTFLKLNKPQKAGEEFLKVLELREQINNLHNFGTRYEKALIDFDYSLLYNTLAFWHFNEGDIQKAKNFYKEAIRINPGFAQSYNDLAGVYFYEKMYKKAESMIKEALKLDPTNELYKNNLKKIYEKGK